ncbi:MAG: RNA polymerase sigma factor [Lachnospiraceae bacterium]
MIYSEEYKEHIEYTFAAFCKVVLRNAAISTYRDFGRKQKREVSLEYLISETPFEPFTTDAYFEQYDQPTIFVVKGQEIVVASKWLADALLRLSEQRRNVLFLYFFFGYTDAQIGKEYGRNRSTANYWKLTALKQLRKEMERLEHEEQEADTF